MNQPSQIRNLLEFTAIFLSGDLKLAQQSTDYIKEKYDKYIGFPIKHTSETTNLYKDWSRTWGENKDINSIFLYFTKIYTVYKVKDVNDKIVNHWLLKLSPNDILETFRQYIGDPEQITTKRYTNVHPAIKRQILDEYINENKRFFKFLRILNDNENEFKEK